MKDIAQRTVQPAVGSPTWVVVCSGVTPALTQITERFCGLTDGYHYAGACDAATPSLAADHATEPVLVVYATHWFDAVGERGLSALHRHDARSGHQRPRAE